MENISKQVISLEDKKVVGYILRPYIDFKSLKKIGYILVDEESEQEYFLKNEDILKKKTFFLIKNINFLEIFNNFDNFRKRVISVDGDDFGQVRSFVFERNALKKLVTDKGEISSRYINEVGENLIILSFKRKKKKAFPRAIKEDMKVEIMEKKFDLPPVINLSSKYYLGKTASKTLLGINHELIVKEGAVVTKQIFEKAKKHNKINELFFILNG